MHLFLALKDKGKFGFEWGITTKTIRLKLEFRGTEPHHGSVGEIKIISDLIPAPPQKRI